MTIPQETGLTMIVTKVDITSAKKNNKVALVYLLHTHVGPKIKKKQRLFMVNGVADVVR